MLGIYLDFIDAGRSITLNTTNAGVLMMNMPKTIILHLYELR